MLQWPPILAKIQPHQRVQVTKRGSGTFDNPQKYGGRIQQVGIRLQIKIISGNRTLGEDPGFQQGYGGAASVLMLESAAKASASMLGTASNYRQSQTFTKVCLDHGAMINESCTPTPHSMRSDVDLHAASPVAQNKQGRESVYILARVYFQIANALNISVRAVDPSIFIERFACNLGFEEKTHMVCLTALRLIQRMKRDWIHAGRKPSGLCGAALLIAARLHNFSRTTKDIVKVVGASESTLNKRNGLKLQAKSDFHQSVPGSWCHDQRKLHPYTPFHEKLEEHELMEFVIYTFAFNNASYLQMCRLVVRLMEFKATPSSGLSLEDFFTVDYSEEQDPPAYTRGLQQAALTQPTATTSSEILQLQRQIEQALEQKSKHPLHLTEEMNKIPYRQTIGSLMYLMTGTRPDIAYAVSRVSQFMNNPGPSHWTAVKKIFGYLKATKNIGICFGGSSCTTSLIGFSDADFAGDLDTRKSTTGYVFMLNNGPISWCSQKQNCVSLSTTESEYIAASKAMKEAIWLRQLLRELHQEQVKPTTIFSGNQSCIRLVHNPEYHKRTKHIDISYHFIRDHFQKHAIDLLYVCSNDQAADIFTKALPPERYRRLRSQLGLFETTKCLLEELDQLDPGHAHMVKEVRQITAASLGITASIDELLGIVSAKVQLDDIPSREKDLLLRMTEIADDDLAAEGRTEEPINDDLDLSGLIDEELEELMSVSRRGWRDEIRRPRLFYTCSMGFRSGDRAGQFIRAIAWFWRKVSTTSALCGWALSSIRRKSSPISTVTMCRRLHKKGLYARRPIICVPLTPPQKRARELWRIQHVAWNPDEWRHRYRDEILAAYVMPQALEMGENFLLMDDNAHPHRAGVVDTFLQNHAIARMNWPARSPDLNPIEHECLLTTDEIRQKHSFWSKVNNDYLKEQEEREKKKKLEEEEAAQKPQIPKKKRLRKKDQAEAANAGEAIQKMLRTKKISMDCDILRNIEPKTPSRKRKPQMPTCSNLTLLKDKMNLLRKSLAQENAQETEEDMEDQAEGNVQVKQKTEPMVTEVDESIKMEDMEEDDEEEEMFSSQALLNAHRGTEEPINDDLDLSGLIDEELEEECLLTTDEIRQKHSFWSKVNNDYLKEQEEREKKKKLEEEEAAQKPQIPKKKRLRKKDQAEAANAGEAIQKMLRTKKISMDCDILRNIEPKTPSRKRKPQMPTCSNLTLLKDKMNLLRKSLAQENAQETEEDMEDQAEVNVQVKQKTEPMVTEVDESIKMEDMEEDDEEEEMFSSQALLNAHRGHPPQVRWLDYRKGISVSGSVLPRLKVASGSISTPRNHQRFIYGFDFETTQQASEWRFKNEPRPKKVRKAPSKVKVMLTVFFDYQGIVHREFQQQGSTITADSYLGVLRRLREAIRQKRPELWRSKSWILHHDNAPAHTALKISKSLQDHSTSVFPQPPYSPDLAPCDFFLFGKLKKIQVISVSFSWNLAELNQLTGKFHAEVRFGRLAIDVGLKWVSPRRRSGTLERWTAEEEMINYLWLF
ncbi:hypothetical protein LAZ67_3004741 [Cordylochernes scorpioides]|uniref:Cyclin-like domain-containing protein n=1 Tax=Cordylochernes scorpioides TaxID=51811 RepID=A0ABY6KD32_9ARAC|nr:hypothetical protein LAZ67_3004741 [Cordylochernes scorpioides]